ncbi:hypothetical protein OPQ81_011073 [Rhizoctonia solani]|nr:hypothetical protein OPQ81_011073 [Rhizoctonia solani]
MSDNLSEGKTLRSGLKVIKKAITKCATISDLRNKSSSSLTTLKKSKLNESNDSIISCAGSQGSDDRKRKVPTAENTNIISNISPGGTQEAVAEFNDAESTYSVPSTPVPQAQPPSLPTNLVPDSQQSEAILSAVEAFDEMSDDISSGSTPKAAPQELVSESPIPSQASSRGQSQPREEYPRRHFFHDCPDNVDPDDTWMLNAIEWLRLDFLLMEKLSRGRMKADKSTDDKQATNRIISKIEQVMTEGLQEMGQLSIQANQAFREAILADDIDDDTEEIPTSQPLTEGYIDIDMESVENPIIDYKEFVAPPTPQSHSKTAHVPEHEVTHAHPQSEEQSMLTQIMSELKNVKAAIQRQQTSINRLEKREFSRPPRPTPSTTRPSPPPVPKTKQQAQKKPSVTFAPPPPSVQKSSSEPNIEPKPMSYAKASTNPSNKPKSDTGHIAAAIKKGASPKVLDETKGLRYLVRFSNLPHLRPDTPSLCALLRDTLATNNKTLGGGRLINSSWSFKGNLTLIFSKNTPAKAIDVIIPLLMNAIEAPMTTFGIEKKWYRIVIPKCPTGLTIPGRTQAYSKSELLQITREAFRMSRGPISIPSNSHSCPIGSPTLS